MTTAGHSELGTRNSELLCPGCGYNVSGLAPDGRCPECGRAVAAAADDRLDHADQQWLRRVYRGLGLIALGVAFGLLWELLGVGFRRPPIPVRVLAMLSLVDLLRGAALLAGSVLITSPEPRLARQESGVTLRRFIRASATVGFLFDTLGSVRCVLAMHPLLGILAKLGQLVGLCTLVNQVFYLRRLAGRTDDRFLRLNLDLIVHGFVGVSVLAALLSVAGLAERVLGLSPPEMLSSVLIALPRAVVFLAPALGLLSVAALLRFRRRLWKMIDVQATVGAQLQPDC